MYVHRWWILSGKIMCFCTHIQYCGLSRNASVDSFWVNYTANTFPGVSLATSNSASWVHLVTIDIFQHGLNGYDTR